MLHTAIYAIHKQLLCLQFCHLKMTCLYFEIIYLQKYQPALIKENRKLHEL